MERDLSGRCGTCGFYVPFARDEAGRASGDCRLGCWPSPLLDTATCSSHKPIGASFEGALKRRPAAGAPRRDRQEAQEPPPRPHIPKEIDLDMDQDEFRTVLREVLLDELGIRDVTIPERWAGGELVLVPGREGTQEKRIPLEAFFHKIVMVRDKLRVLEQKINGNKALSDGEKVQLQHYITGCYGSLTTFNILFRDREDGFVGQSSKG